MNLLYSHRYLLEKYPIKMETIRQETGGPLTRSNLTNKFKEEGRTNVMKHSFVGDSARLWNRAPTCIKMAKKISSAKLEIRKYVTTLPV